jgi:hypothetical protein
MLEGFDLNSIQDVGRAREGIMMLLNLVEDLKLENRELREENQRLRDDINRLKGEQGKPDIKPNKPVVTTNHSSEQERRRPKERQKSSKVNQIKIDRQQVLTFDRAKLPPDAEFKGYEKVIVQDILIRTDNVLFLKEKYYSAGERKTYLAEMPNGYKGQFGPGVKAMALVLYYSGNMAEPKIMEFFEHIGLQISSGQLSNLLIKDHQPFHAEKDALYEAGLRSSCWQHIDDTGTRVNGQNQYCHVVCNPLYTAYFTTDKKSRLKVLDVLNNLRDRTFRLNPEAYQFLDLFSLPARVIDELKKFPQEQSLSEKEFTGLLDKHLPKLGVQQRTHIMEAAAVAAYHAQLEFPVVRLLICDDAPQFKWITEELALCWIHDGRHYKKLQPVVAYHQKELESFRGKYWTFYDQLLNYRMNPTPEDAARLSKEFDELFSTVTGYNALDDRIAKTKDKKHCLLMVLHHHEIPLHNNPAELGARTRTRKRDVSSGPRTEDGKKAWDTFMSLVNTAKKLGLSVYRFFYDRVTETHEIPCLADLITEKAKSLNLDGSWNPP